MVRRRNAMRMRPAAGGGPPLQPATAATTRVESPQRRQATPAQLVATAKRARRPCHGATPVRAWPRPRNTARLLRPEY